MIWKHCETCCGEELTGCYCRAADVERLTGERDEAKADAALSREAEAWAAAKLDEARSVARAAIMTSGVFSKRYREEMAQSYPWLNGKEASRVAAPSLGDVLHCADELTRENDRLKQELAQEKAAGGRLARTLCQRNNELATLQRMYWTAQNELVQAAANLRDAAQLVKQIDRAMPGLRAVLAQAEANGTNLAQNEED